MPRGYRRYLVAALGCLILAAVVLWLLKPEQPRLRADESVKAIQSSYEANHPECQPPGLAKLSARKRPPKAADCAERAEQHYEQASGLVQARRQADAANASTILAYKQTWIAACGAVLGLLTLIAAGLAAYFAKQAADWTRASAEHTKTGAEEARRSADASVSTLAETRKANQVQLRPYIAFDAPDDARFDVENSTPIRIMVKNFGTVPASEVVITHGDRVVNRPIAEQRVIHKQRSSIGLLAPTDKQTIEIEISYPIGKARIDFDDRKTALIVFLRVDYHWEGGSDFEEVETFYVKEHDEKKTVYHRLNKTLRYLY